jgi:integrating conjugative element protein (TIGR03758 family)
MNDAMRQGFLSGSGVDPETLRLTIQMIACGVILLVFAYCIQQIFVAYSNERIDTSQAIWNTIKLAVVMGFLFFELFR